VERRRSMGDDSTIRPLRRIEFYWLRENCVQKMTLAFDRDAGITA